MNARRRVLRPAMGAGLVLAVIAGFGLSASPPGSGGRAGERRRGPRDHDRVPVVPVG